MAQMKQKNAGATSFPIENLTQCEDLYKILSWKDDKHKIDGSKMRFRMSGNTYFVFECIKNKFFMDSITNLARGLFILGLRTEAIESKAAPGLMEALKEELDNHPAYDFHERVFTDRLSKIKPRDTTRKEIYNAIRWFGDCILYENVKFKIADVMGFPTVHDAGPRVIDIRSATKHCKLGKTPNSLGPDRFNCRSGKDNVDISFVVSERIDTLVTIMKKRLSAYDQMRRSKFSRGMLVKGLYVVARWIEEQDPYMTECYKSKMFISEIKKTLYGKGNL